MGVREAVTVRFPGDLLTEARAVKTERESLNDLVTIAVEREVRRRQGLRAYEDIVRLREQIFDRTGLQPDSGAMIRALRDGVGRDD